MSHVHLYPCRTCPENSRAGRSLSIGQLFKGAAVAPPRHKVAANTPRIEALLGSPLVIQVKSPNVEAPAMLGAVTLSSPSVTLPSSVFASARSHRVAATSHTPVVDDGMLDDLSMILLTT